MRTPAILKRGEKGAATLEAALILPVFLSLVFGFVQFAFIMCGYNSAAFAVRTGARYAIVHGSASPSPCSSASLKTLVQGQLLAPVSQVNVTSSGWNANGTLTPGSTVTVSASITYTPAIPYVHLGPLTVTAFSQMTVIQ